MKFILVLFFFTITFVVAANAEDAAECEARHSACMGMVKDFRSTDEQAAARAGCESERLNCLGRIPVPTPRPDNEENSNHRQNQSNPAPPAPNVENCIADFRQRSAACSAAASTAVEKCDPKREESDSAGGIQNLLKAMDKSGSASENCSNIGMASSSGYHEMDKVRGKCENEINACRSSCAEATSHINNNKEKVFRDCVVAESSRSVYEREVQEILRTTGDKTTVCTTGAATTNRDKISDMMGEMNTSAKSASQCQCQLSSSAENCKNLAGPAECAKDPNLPGCELAKINCLSGDDKSQQCACFRDPKSKACTNMMEGKGFKTVDYSGFAAPGGSETSPVVQAAPFGRGAVGDLGNLTVSDINSLGRKNIKVLEGASGVAAPAEGTASVATASDNAQAVAASSGGVASASVATGRETASGKVSGFFESARSAIGSFFSGGKDSGKKYSDAQKGKNKSGKVDPKKWRPRGMVRGLASDEMGDKYDDIWKVMNKQYKVQDQNNKFLVGAEP